MPRRRQNLKEEWAILQFLKASGGLCPTSAFEEYARQGSAGHLKGEMENLLLHGLVLQPDPGQLYILSESGHRRHRILQKQDANTRRDAAGPDTPSS